MLMLFGIEVHSQEQYAVNLPGSSACRTAAIVSFHTAPAIAESIGALTDRPPNSTVVA
jgi:hypothetical protein